MVEGGSDKVPEEVILEAIFKAHDEILKIVEAQEKLREMVGKPKREIVPPVEDGELIEKIHAEWGARIENAVAIAPKLERHEALSKIYDEILTSVEGAEQRRSEILGYLEKIEGKFVRSMILDKGVRIGGRGFKDIRDISCEVGCCPAHTEAPCLPAGKLRLWLSSPWGRPRTNRRSKPWKGRATNPLSSITSFRRSVLAK